MSALQTFIMRKITGSQGEPNLDDLLDKSDRMMTQVALHPVAAHECSSSRHTFAGGNPTKHMSKRQLLRYMPKGAKELLSFFSAMRLIKQKQALPTASHSALLAGHIADFFDQHGVVTWGYAEVSPDLVFAGKIAPSPHAVVFGLPMDKDSIAQAPDFRVLLEVADAYGRVGQLANALTKTLRRQGVWALPGHPLGGLVSYPRLAENAGLGKIGRSGMLISPELGPCQRIGAVFIGNAIIREQSRSHEWVTQFCNTCGACARRCPPQAIPLSTSLLEQKPGADGDRCLPFFHQNWGCSLCIAVCPFTVSGYDKIAALWQKKAKTARGSAAGTVHETE